MKCNISIDFTLRKLSHNIKHLVIRNRCYNYICLFNLIHYFPNHRIRDIFSQCSSIIANSKHPFQITFKFLYFQIQKRISKRIHTRFFFFTYKRQCLIICLPQIKSFSKVTVLPRIRN